jgi:predicted DNA-binding transcriptional regulator AlpA
MKSLRLVRKKEFAARLNVRNTKFWQLQKQGEIPDAIKLPGPNGMPGRVSYWSEEVVDATVDKFLNEACGAAKAAIILGSRLNDPFGRVLPALHRGEGGASR